jgi:hypothetical protein
MYIKRHTKRMLLDLINTVENQSIDTLVTDIRAFKELKKRLVADKVLERIKKSRKHNRRHRTKLSRVSAKHEIYRGDW